MVFSHADFYHSKENELVLTCKVRGNPRPVVAWSKDGEAIVPNERIQQIENVEGQCELLISNPTPEDSGNYVCTAGNKLDTVEQEHLVCFLQADLPISRRASVGDHSKNAFGGGITTIDRSDTTAVPVLLHSIAKETNPEEEKKPEKKTRAPYVRRHGVPSAELWEQLARHKLSFITHLTSRTFPAGQRVKLTCLVDGPEQTAHWFKDGRKIVSGSRVKYHNRHGHCQLEIMNCKVDDTGEYSVTVHNSDCKISSACTVKVFATHQPSDASPQFTRTLKCTLCLCYMCSTCR